MRASSSACVERRHAARPGGGGEAVGQRREARGVVGRRQEEGQAHGAAAERAAQRPQPATRPRAAARRGSARRRATDAVRGLVEAVEQRDVARARSGAAASRSRSAARRAGARGPRAPRSSSIVSRTASSSGVVTRQHERRAAVGEHRREACAGGRRSGRGGRARRACAARSRSGSEWPDAGASTTTRSCSGRPRRRALEPAVHLVEDEELREAGRGGGEHLERGAPEEPPRQEAEAEHALDEVGERVLGLDARRRQRGRDARAARRRASCAPRSGARRPSPTSTASVRRPAPRRRARARRRRSSCRRRPSP